MCDEKSQLALANLSNRNSTEQSMNSITAYSARKVTISAKYAQYILRFHDTSLSCILYTSSNHIFVIWCRHVKSVMTINIGDRQKKASTRAGKFIIIRGDYEQERKGMTTKSVAKSPTQCNRCIILLLVASR